MDGQEVIEILDSDEDGGKDEKGRIDDCVDIPEVQDGMTLFDENGSDVEMARDWVSQAEASSIPEVNSSDYWLSDDEMKWKGLTPYSMA